MSFIPGLLINSWLQVCSCHILCVVFLDLALANSIWYLTFCHCRLLSYWTFAWILFSLINKTIAAHQILCGSVVLAFFQILLIHMSKPRLYKHFFTFIHTVSMLFLWFTTIASILSLMQLQAFCASVICYIRDVLHWNSWAFHQAINAVS